MKCKLHPCEVGAGVCASCLRQRLLALVAAYDGVPPQRHRPRRSEESPSPPSPLAFPRSVSPYLSGSSRRRHVLFFSTPQIGPTFVGEVGPGRRRGFQRLSALRVLFGRRRSERGERDCESGGSSGSSSWLSALIRRKKKKPKTCSTAEGETQARIGRCERSRRAVDRGMSPAVDDEETDVSGYSSESTNGWRHPTPTSVRQVLASGRSQRHHQGRLGSVSGFAVCLSPLMWGTASGRRGHMAEASSRVSQFSGDLRSPAYSVPHHRSAAARSGSFGLRPSRSRKLADFGRFN